MALHWMPHPHYGDTTKLKVLVSDRRCRATVNKKCSNCESLTATLAESQNQHVELEIRITGPLVKIKTQMIAI